MSDIIHGWRSENINILGLSETTKCLGTGYVQWEFMDINNKPVMLEVLAFCVPAAHIRLCSPQNYLNTDREGSYTLLWNKSVLKTGKINK